MHYKRQELLSFRPALGLSREKAIGALHKQEEGLQTAASDRHRQIRT